MNRNEKLGELLAWDAVQTLDKLYEHNNDNRHGMKDFWKEKLPFL